MLSTIVVGLRTIARWGSELKRLFAWFQSGRLGMLEEHTENGWQLFFDAVHRFQDGIMYLLAVDHIDANAPVPLHALGMPPWRAVIDFDPDSDTTGFLSHVAGLVGNHRVIHRVVHGEYRVQPDPGTHWFFARGLSGRQETLTAGGQSTWLKS